MDLSLVLGPTALTDTSTPILRHNATSLSPNQEVILSGLMYNKDVLIVHPITPCDYNKHPTTTNQEVRSLPPI